MTEGQRIKYLRKDILKLTLAKFGKELGVAVSTISEVENGRNALSNQMIMLIRRTYHVSEDWLRNGTGDVFVSEDPDERIANLTATLTEKDEESDLLELVEMLSQMDDEDVHKMLLIAEILTNKKG